MLPHDASASGLVLLGLGEVFADARARESLPVTPATEQRRGGTVRAFESTPAPLRSALLVDPDPEARRALALCLLRHGFTVYEAASGQDALRLLRSRAAPGWSSPSCSSATRAASSSAAACARTACWRCTPVVFLSKQDDCNSRHGALSAGADDFLVEARAVARAPGPARARAAPLHGGRLRRGARRRPARSRGADGSAGGAADLPPESAHRIGGGPTRQPVAADRVPSRADRLGDRPRPPRHRRSLRFHLLAAGALRVRPRRGRRRRADQRGLQRAAARGLPMPRPAAARAPGCRYTAHLQKTRLSSPPRRPPARAAPRLTPTKEPN